MYACVLVQVRSLAHDRQPADTMVDIYKFYDTDNMMLDGGGGGGGNGFYKMTVTTTNSSISRGGGTGGSIKSNGTTTHVSRTSVISSSGHSTTTSTSAPRGPHGGPVPDSVYVEKLHAILGPEFPAVSVPHEPTALIGLIYLGTSANADNKKMLKSLGIRHLLNCAGTTITNFRRKSKKVTSSSTVKSYEEIYAEDTEDYEIRSHFDQVLHVRCMCAVCALYVRCV